MATIAPRARFERIRRLGEGASGVVYEALDHQLGTRVALKTLRKVTDDSLARLKQEFLTIQGVHHPNLVTLGELVLEGDDCFFTMELVEGSGWLDHVRPPGRLRFDEARLRDGLMQLAGGLSALHDAGFVHRDVKPSNVRVTPAGRVVLLDFGLVVDLNADNPWAQQGAGTPAYMAPEQVVSTQIGPEADWYAVGVLLFEALTGRVPFDGPPLDVMTRKQHEEPPRAASVAGGVPADLDALCSELLRFDPDVRPPGRRVLRALGGRPMARPAGRPASHTLEVPFVGRSMDLGALMAAFHDSRRGQPVTVLVEGPSGIGKSALLRRFLERLHLEVPSAVALAGRCDEHDVAPYRAFRPLAEALARGLGQLDPAEARSIVPNEPLALVKVFPALRRVESIAELARGALPPFAPLGLRARAFGLLRELFKRLGDARPVVLVIDDAHHADDDSLALLGEIMRVPDAPRLLLVLTAETATAAAALHDEKPSTEWRGRSLADLLDETTRRITLGALPFDDASALAVDLLDAAGDDQPGTAQWVARQTAGVPLFLDFMVRHTERLSSRMGTDLPFADVVRGAILGLDDGERAILEAVCVSGAPMARDVLARAVAVDGTVLTGAIAHLSVSHLTSTSGTRDDPCVAPYHDRVRAAVLEQLAEARRAELHRRIAEALETAGRVDPGALAVHWRAAGDPVQAARYAGLAANAALEVLAFDCAARSYELALSSQPGSDAERRALLVKLGKARGNAGWGKRAAEAFLSAAEGANPSQALDLRRRASEELLMAGDVQGGTAILREVLARVGMWMPTSRLATIASYLFFRAILRLRGMRYVLRDEARVPPTALIRIHVCWVVARVLGTSDRPVALYFQTRMLLLALRYAEPTVLAGALVLEGGFLSAKGAGTRGRVERLLTRAESIARESAAPFARVAGPRMRGLAATLQGRFVEALELNELATARLMEMAPEEYLAIRQTEIYSLWALARLGEIKELSARLTRALREATDRHDVETIAALRVQIFATAWLRKGDSRALRTGIHEALVLQGQVPMGHQHLAALSEVDLYEGLGEDAYQRIDFQRARRAYRLNVEIIHCLARHLRGRAAVLAAAQTRPGMGSKRRRLIASAQRDAQWLRRAPPAYATHWGVLVEAGIAGVKGQRERAKALLEEAIAGLDAGHERLLAAAARMRLGVLRGAQGLALLEAGESFMLAQEIADPARMAAALVPGV